MSIRSASGHAAVGDVREVRRWLRARRRGRAASGGVERVYLALLSAAVFVPMTVVAILYAAKGIQAHHNSGAGAPPETVAALTLLWTALWLALAARIGPITLSPASVAWLLPTPLNRRRLLLPSLIAVLAVGAFAGLGNGFIAVLGLAPPLPEAASTIGAAVASGVALAALLVLTQWRFPGEATVIGWYAALMCLVAVALTIRPWQPQTRWDWDFGGAGPVSSAVAALVLGVVAWLVSGRLRHSTIVAGSSFAWTITAGIVTVDPGIAARAAEDIRLTHASPKRPGLGTGRGPWVVVRQDLLSLRRAPERLILAAGLAALPTLLHRMLDVGWLFGLVWILCGLLAVGLTTGNVRRDRDLPALTRLLGLPQRKLLAARAVVPAVVGMMWAAASLDWWAFVAGPALAAGAIRAARRGRVRHEFPPIVTPVGYIPTGLLYWIVTGLDLGLLLLTPAFLHILGLWPPAMVAAQTACSVLGLTALIASRRRYEVPAVPQD